MASLDNRLMTAAAMCRKGKIVCDVGCDHARLACYLAANGAREVIASDAADGPLGSARRTVETSGMTNVRVVKSDGLAEIDFADDVVICGMGGELISEIMSGCRFVNADTRFILQPMTKANRLRCWLCENGFEIIEEKSASDAGFLYTVMLVKYTGVRREPDEMFALTGKNTDSEYLSMIAEKLKKSVSGMERSALHRDEAAKLREIAEQISRKADGFR